MRNPDAMREAMRGQDLAMSQIENLPGGFNALRRVFEDVQEPLMNAQMQQPNNTNNSSAQNSSAASSGGALPNPWGGNTTNNSANANNAMPANMFNMFGAGAQPANPFGALIFITLFCSIVQQS